MGCRVGALCQFSWKDQRGLEKQKHRQGALPQGASLQPCPHLRQSLLGLVLESPPWFCSTSQEQPSCLGWIRVAVCSAPLLPLCSPVSVTSPLMEKSTCPAFLHSTPLRLGSCCLRRCSKTVPSVQAEATQENIQRVAGSRWAEGLLRCGRYQGTHSYVKPGMHEVQL